MSSNLKVAMITSSVSRSAGGLLWAMRPLAQELIQRNCTVEVFGGDDEYATEDKGDWSEVPVTILRRFGPKSFGGQVGLAKAISHFRPDVIHGHGLWMYPSLVAGTFTPSHIPRVVSPHGMLDPWALKNSAWKKRIVSFLYEDRNLKGSGCVHALCQEELQAIRSYGLDVPVAVIPNGVELPDFSSPVGEPIWNDLLPRGGKVLFYLSRLHPKKGLPNLLKAWQEVKSRSGSGFEEWFLVVAGWAQDGYESELKSLAQELKIESSVVFVGPQFGVRKSESLVRADAFVLPSFSEGLPIAVLEAWAHSLPVIMTDYCNLPEGFSSSAAIRVAPEVRSLARGLEQLFLMSDADRETMGRNGRGLVEMKFVWSEIAKQMEALYCWSLGGSALPSFVSKN